MTTVDVPRRGGQPARLGASSSAPAPARLRPRSAASRLLAPYFGCSTIVWANMIGLVLACARRSATGSAGRLADRRPEPRLLGWIVLARRSAVARDPFVARPFLDSAVGGLTRSPRRRVGSFFAGAAPFAPPVDAARDGLAVRDPARAQRRRDGGRCRRAALRALHRRLASLGTFVAALIAIPLVGTQRTLLGTAALLALSAAFLLGAAGSSSPPALAALARRSPPGRSRREPGSSTRTESLYQFIQVVAAAATARASSASTRASPSTPCGGRDTVLTGGEWDMFLVVPPLLDRPLRRMRDARQRRRDDGARLGRFYPGVRSTASSSTRP